MSKPFTLAALFVSALASFAAAQQTSSPVADPVIDGVLKFKKVIELPAVEAGVLLQLNVKEGDLVRKDDLIAQTPERQDSSKSAPSTATPVHIATRPSTGNVDETET